MMTDLQYGKQTISLEFPEKTIVYRSEYPSPPGRIADHFIDSLNNPDGSDSLINKLKRKRNGSAVIVVSDFTRPIPYFEILPLLIDKILNEGILRKDLILIATGMHRPSTNEENIMMFDEYVAKNFIIVNHDCQNDDELEEIRL